MVSVEFSKRGEETVTKDLSKDELMKLFSEIESCIDVDCRSHDEIKVNGLDFRLPGGNFLSIGIDWDMMWGECEHSIYVCVSDEDPREWRKEQELKYAKMRGD
jgi:hypothetical protein